MGIIKGNYLNFIENMIKEQHISEARLQYECVTWFWNTYPVYRGLLYHIPNGGKRTAREASTLKSVGVVSGIPDLCLAIPRSGSGALYIELKTETGKVRPEQEKTISRLRQAGNKAEVIKNLSTFIELVENYIKSK